MRNFFQNQFEFNKIDTQRFNKRTIYSNFILDKKIAIKIESAAVGIDESKSKTEIIFANIIKTVKLILEKLFNPICLQCQFHGGLI